MSVPREASRKAASRLDATSPNRHTNGGRASALSPGCELWHTDDMELYLVGGAVRDLLLGRAPAELDYAFDGETADFLRAHPDARLVGKSVHVCLWRGRECMPLRGRTLEADLLARDLTINALALDARGILHAHPQALGDLRAGLLRPASETAFIDDPARIFRLARFAAQWPDWQVGDQAYAQMRALPRGRLLGIPAERIGRELRKALAAPAPGRFLEVLAEGDTLAPWFAELEAARHIPAGPARWHKNSVFGHSLRIMNQTAGSELAAWMALCHDLGKIATDPQLLPHHYGHELQGVPLARALAERLRLPALFAKAGALAAAEHMKAGIFHRLRPGTRRDLLWRVHQTGLSKAFWQLADADSQSAISAEAARQLQVILSVRLPEADRNKGTLSAQKLRDLQCRALANAPAAPHAGA